MREKPAVTLELPDHDGEMAEGEEAQPTRAGILEAQARDLERIIQCEANRTVADDLHWFKVDRLHGFQPKTI